MHVCEGRGKGIEINGPKLFDSRYADDSRQKGGEGNAESGVRLIKMSPRLINKQNLVPYRRALT